MNQLNSKPGSRSNLTNRISLQTQGQMKKTSKGSIRPFYAVQFIKLPFEGIDDYECVPDSWVILRRSSDRVVLVAYPTDEDPFDTRDRAKRREKYGDNWQFYLAIIKYESDTYEDAAFWIATRNDYGPCAEEDSIMEATRRPKPAPDRKLSSITQKHSSKSKKSKPQITVKPSDQNPRKPMVKIPINRPIQSKSESEVDKKRLESTEAAVPISTIMNQATRQQSCHPESVQAKQMPMIRRNNIVPERRKQETPAGQSKETNSNSQTHLPSNMTAAQPYQYTTAQPSPSSISETRSLSTCSMERKPPMVTQKHSRNASKVPVMNARNSIEGNCIDQRSLLRGNANSSQQTQRVPKGQAERSYNSTTIQKLPRQGASNSTSASQNRSNSAHHPHSFVQIIHGQQGSPAQESNGSLAIDRRVHFEDLLINEAFTSRHRSNPTASHPNENLPCSRENLYLPVNQDNLQQERHRQELLKRSTDSNYSDHGSNSRTTSIGVPCDEQQLMNVSIQFNQNMEPPQQRQLQTNHQNLPRDPRVPKIHGDISVKSKFNGLITLQGVTKAAPSPLLSKASKSVTQATLSGGSAEQSNINIAAAPRNTTAEPTYDMHSFEMPSCSSNLSQEIQRPSVHDNVFLHLRVKRRLVDRSTETNTPMKRVRFQDDIVRSSATVTTPQRVDSASQTDRCITEESLSAYHEVASDHEAVTDHQVVSDHDMSTNETPVDITNDVDSIQITSESNSADRPIAPQSPTTTSLHMHPRIILEQKMLNEFATLFTQMGSTLAYTCDMFNNLRSSILESADTYHNLLYAVEQFNTLGDSASTPSSSSNVTSEVPHVTEKNRTGVTEGETSGSGSQCNNNVVNEALKRKHKYRWTFALPPEYDPNDTKWTLKYRENRPGLVELMPESRIYVSYGELHYCTRVSKNCTVLARLLLLEVFNTSALSVCETLTERQQASNNEGSKKRPKLDTHACIVLLKFLQKRALQCGWDTDDTKDILKGMHSKMQEMRFKYGRSVRC